MCDERPRAGASILTHICCAPCATYTVNRLREEGWDVAGLWYNPNIHPWQEHERRRVCLQRYAGEIGLPVQWVEGYAMPAFLRAVSGREQFRARCAICYEMRLAETARRARAGGFAAFTTTLLISPYQDQRLIREIGERLGQAEGVEFYFENFRRGWAERGRLSAAHNLYLQQYCGCVYSEYERYHGGRIDELLPATP
jgi:predicted adenine nucleotide alpha hydrolase (AANH) superfamily ATPase